MTPALTDPPARRYAGEPGPGEGGGPTPAALACRQLLREFRAIRSGKAGPARPCKPHRRGGRPVPEVDPDRLEPEDLEPYVDEAGRRLDDRGRPLAERRSRFRGVFWDRSERTWRAQVYAHGKYHLAGRSRDEATAARIRDALAVRLLGEDAPLNFPGR